MRIPTYGAVAALGGNNAAHRYQGFGWGET